MARRSKNIIESVKDIYLTDDNEFSFKNGDFEINYSDNQHQALILESDLGHFKEFPNLGAALRSDLKSSGYNQEIEAKVRLHIESDGYQVNRVKVDSSLEDLTIILDAPRTRI